MQDEEKPSKTQRKREMHELQALGARLAELNPEQLAAVPLPDGLRDALADLRRMTKHEARRRQMQYIGRLMRSVEPGPIREKLKVWDGVSAEHTARQHRVERWRDRLLEDESAVDELVRAHPWIDARHLRALARRAREERAAGSPPRAYRELFRALREIVAGSAREGDAA
ncbi:MAG TPA: ribosome biogenesis factor YjgA [Burkholderiales bacterium]|nr:ribosome biogenesis factor YjgA [Burkholderiales bacterium]